MQHDPWALGPVEGVAPPARPHPAPAAPEPPEVRSWAASADPGARTTWLAAVLACVALVAGGVLVAAVALAVAPRDEEPVDVAVPTRTSTPLAVPRPVPLADVAVGDCLVDLGEAGEDDLPPLRGVVPDPVGRAQEVPCPAPHLYEAYAVVRLPGVPVGTGFFDVDVADEACYAAFSPYVDEAWEVSDLDYAALRPSDDASVEQGQVVCVLLDLDLVPLQGSARGSGR